MKEGKNKVMEQETRLIDNGICTPYWANDEAFALSPGKFQFTWVKALFSYRINLLV